MVPYGYYQDIYNKVVDLIEQRPGVWAMHCHNGFQASTGMFMQIVQQPMQLRDVLGTWSLDPSNDPPSTCEQGNGSRAKRSIYTQISELVRGYGKALGPIYPSHQGQI
ncbi:hypothetical protein VTL71DRAFT_5039 [Oculimacula yallundae]|uniref:Plastocyanin-like domain-containing protein n=1 Tax=Oculimacula yallundae TaxID=86028 RepID=A0ABR4C004_9HELO